MSIHRPFNYQPLVRKNSFYPNFVSLLDGIIIAGIIIFLTSNFLFFHGEKVTLPVVPADSQFAQATEVLSVTKDGQYFFRNRKESVESFFPFFLQSHKENPVKEGSTLLIKLDGDERMQTFVDLKKAAESVGYAEILIATESSSR